MRVPFVRQEEHSGRPHRVGIPGGENAALAGHDDAQILRTYEVLERGGHIRVNASVVGLVGVMGSTRPATSSQGSSPDMRISWSPVTGGVDSCDVAADSIAGSQARVAAQTRPASHRWNDVRLSADRRPASRLSMLMSSSRSPQ